MNPLLMHKYTYPYSCNKKGSSHARDSPCVTTPNNKTPRRPAIIHHDRHDGDGKRNGQERRRLLHDTAHSYTETIQLLQCRRGSQGNRTAQNRRGAQERIQTIQLLQCSRSQPSFATTAISPPQKNQLTAICVNGGTCGGTECSECQCAQDYYSISTRHAESLVESKERHCRGGRGSGLEGDSQVLASE